MSKGLFFLFPKQQVLELIIRMTSTTPPWKQPCDMKSVDFKRIDITGSKTYSKSNFEMCSKIQFPDNSGANVGKNRTFSKCGGNRQRITSNHILELGRPKRETSHCILRLAEYWSIFEKIDSTWIPPKCRISGKSRCIASLIEKTWTDKKYQIVQEFVSFVFSGKI